LSNLLVSVRYTAHSGRLRLLDPRLNIPRSKLLKTAAFLSKSGCLRDLINAADLHPIESMGHNSGCHQIQVSRVRIVVRGRGKVSAVGCVRLRKVSNMQIRYTAVILAMSVAMATSYAQTSTPNSTGSQSTGANPSQSSGQSTGVNPDQTGSQSTGANSSQTDTRDKAKGQGTYGAGSTGSAGSGSGTTDMKPNKTKRSKKMDQNQNGNTNTSTPPSNTNPQ